MWLWLGRAVRVGWRRQLRRNRRGLNTQEALSSARSADFALSALRLARAQGMQLAVVKGGFVAFFEDHH